MSYQQGPIYNASPIKHSRNLDKISTRRNGSSPPRLLKSIATYYNAGQTGQESKPNQTHLMGYQAAVEVDYYLCILHHKDQIL